MSISFRIFALFIVAEDDDAIDVDGIDNECSSDVVCARVDPEAVDSIVCGAIACRITALSIVAEDDDAIDVDGISCPCALLSLAFCLCAIVGGAILIGVGILFFMSSIADGQEFCSNCQYIIEPKWLRMIEGGFEHLTLEIQNTDISFSV